jgi:hypothetical protein
MKRNQLNSKAVVEAYLNPTPENKYLRDQYQYSYPVYNRLKKSGEKLPERVKEVHGDKVVLANNQHYKGYNVPLKWYCPCCNHTWKQTPEMVLSERLGCPRCAKTKPRKPPIKATLEEKARAVALYQELQSIRKVCDATGRSKNAIKSWIDEAKANDLYTISSEALQLGGLDSVA